LQRVPLLMRLSAFFSHAKNPKFWEEAERAHLLISRLNNGICSNSLTHQFLKKAATDIEDRVAFNASPVCCYLYGAWSALSEQTKNHTESGYEPDDRYLLSLESANDHIFWRVMPYLNSTDFNKTLDLFPVIYNNVSATFASGNACHIDMDDLIVKKFSEMPGM
jgi:hypothetical protein